MAIKSLVVVRSMEDALEVLSRNIVPLKESDFNPSGAYEYPLRSEVPVTIEDEKGGQTPLTGEEGAIIRLDLPTEWQLFQMLELRYGPLEHGGIERQLKVCYSPDGQRYKQNVLLPFWVKTGEMGIKTKKGHEFYKIKEITIMSRQVTPAVIFDDEAQNPISRDYTYTLARRSRVPMPDRVGYFNQIGDTDGRVYWNGTVYEDNEGRSAVRCDGYSVGLGLVAVAGGPLYGGDDGVVGTWRKAS